MGETDGVLYVAFMGTKQRRDLVANAQVIQDPVWPEDAAAFQGATQVGSSVHSIFALHSHSACAIFACLLIRPMVCLSVSTTSNAGGVSTDY